MLQYPEIAGSAKAPLGKPCIAFYKYDGSNLRFEWSSKQGWHKFGTRHQLFNQTDPIFGPGIPYFLDKMGDEILKRCRDVERGVQRITVFCEYYGIQSFAGKHVPGDEMMLRLIDVALYKRGMMKPRLFVKTFGDWYFTAEVIYDGNLNRQFIEDIRQSKYPVWEGVVAKGIDGDWMCKIKTNAYFKKLNEVFGTEYRNYWE
jgi:hypothetical protein